MNSIYRITIVFLLLLVSCKEKDSASNKNKPEIKPKIESEFDKIKLTALDGKPIDLNQYEGKTIFINFWATWCKPCIQELPYIEKAMDKVKNEDIVFFFASNEAVEVIETFKKNHSYDFHYVRLENLEELNIMTLPTTYIFNPDGELVFSEMGYRKWDNKNNIDLILNAAK
jgi:thiol-disulfide isomerase/thioredoxin